MTDWQDVSDVTAHLTSAICATYPHLLRAYPLGEYVDYLDAYPSVAHLQYSSSDVRDYCQRIVRDSSEVELDLYHRLLLLKLIVRARETLDSGVLPEDIKSLYHENFERITQDIRLNRYASGFYLHPTFCKELALCTLRLIPAGVAKIHLEGIPRKYFIRKVATDLLRCMRLLLNVRGFAPFYQMHLDSRDRRAMLRFNHQGWVEFYRRVAVLLELRPSVKGIFGESWFFDPRVADVSPKLAFLTRLVIDNGGALFRQGPCDENDSKDAIYLAPARRRLYLEGKYTPTQYLAVWPRKQLIDWARLNCRRQGNRAEDVAPRPRDLMRGSGV